jgi:hypothetical protein
MVYGGRVLTRPAYPGTLPWPGPASAGWVPVGYLNAPGYPGSLTTWPGGNPAGNATYSFYHFPSGLLNGVVNSNITFVGCLFESNNVADANVSGSFGTACSNITFSYCTFQPMPSVVAAPPVASGQGYEYGIDQRLISALTVDHCDFWGFLAAVQLSSSSLASPDVFTWNCLHDPSNSAIEIDGYLSSDGGGGVEYVVMNYNTFMGNAISSQQTNGVALQYAGHGYNFITCIGNYISGWDYAVSLGGGGAGDGSQSTFVTFSDNTFGADIKPFDGMCNSVNIGLGTGNIWLRNKFYIPGINGHPASPYFGASTSWLAAGNDGLYWYPGDENPAGPSTIIGHSNDF